MNKEQKMTAKEVLRFNKMRTALVRISKKYMTPERMKRECEKGYGAGVDYHECLEMSYENIQQEAKEAVRNIKAIKSKLLTKPNSEQKAQECDATDVK